MKTLLLSNLKRSKGATTLFILAFLVIFLLLPLTLLTIKDVRTQTEKDISQYARGSYDLLLRPIGHRHPLELEMGIVPENYIGFGDGGISLEQWEKVKEHSEVEIAAPVASVGYYTGMKNAYVFETPETSTRYYSQLFTSDGKNDYPLTERYDCTLLEYDGPNPYIFKYEALYTNPDLANFCSSAANFDLPPTYHLVAGIDPLEEEALTGIPFPDIQEDATTGGWGRTYNASFGFFTDIIPIMELDDEGVALEVQATIETLDWKADDTSRMRDKYELRRIPRAGKGDIGELNEFRTRDPGKHEAILEEVRNSTVKSRKKIVADLGTVLRPFNQHESAIITPEGNVRTITDADRQNGTGMMTVFDMTYSTVYYTTGSIDYEIHDDRLHVNISEKDSNGIPLYREVKVHGKDMTKLAQEGDSPTFVLDPVGKFSLGSYQERLSSSPLGIYQLAPAFYVGEDKKEMTRLESTISPGSFITPPAKGVIHIKDAVLLKGDHPIDAIRVKVKGSESYTSSFARKIERLTAEFEKKGFDVVVIAGSSPKYVFVDVEGIGLVRESWTTLGAAGQIIQQWNMAGLLVGISFLLVAVGYVMSRMRFWQISRQPDMTLLYELGWERKYQWRLFRLEISVLLFTAFALSGPLLIAIKKWIGFGDSVFSWHLITFGTVFLILLVTLALVFRKMYREKKRQRQRSSGWMYRKIGLSGKSLLYYKEILFPPFLQIMLVSMLTPFVYLTLSSTIEQTSVTLLGDYINLQIAHLHFLLLAGVILLTAFTLFETITSLFMRRNKEVELLRDLGWNKKYVFGFFLKETGVWIFISVIVGHLIGIVLFTSFFTLTMAAILFFVSSFVISIGVTISVTAWMVHRYIDK